MTFKQWQQHHLTTVRPEHDWALWKAAQEAMRERAAESCRRDDIWENTVNANPDDLEAETREACAVSIEQLKVE